MINHNGIAVYRGCQAQVIDIKNPVQVIRSFGEGDFRLQLGRLTAVEGQIFVLGYAGGQRSAGGRLGYIHGVSAGD